MHCAKYRLDIRLTIYQSFNHNVKVNNVISFYLQVTQGMVSQLMADGIVVNNFF